jgi:hypothetical protein
VDSAGFGVILGISDVPWGINAEESRARRQKEDQPMSDLLNSLLGSQGNLDELAKQFNLSPDQASGALSAITNQLQGSAGEGGLAAILQGLTSGGGGLQGLANNASAQSGVDAGVIVQMIQGFLQNQQGGDLISAVTSALDQNKDGSVIDEVLDIGKKLL